METAKEVGFACNLLNENMEINEIHSEGSATFQD